MATTKITNPDLFDITANTALRLPSGSTEQRPTSPSTGEWRYNTTTNLVEYYDGGKWRELLSEDLPPIPSENFNTVTYTGDGTAGRAVTVGFQPDYVWIKTRNNANSWTNTDSTRGVNAILSSNANASESTFDSSWRSSYGQIASFTSTGFTVNAGSASGNFNTSGSNYVAFCWKANGGTTSSNTDGSITSTVQANTGAGFSVVSYSGTGSTGTYGHGLSSSPDLIITKRRDAVEGWLVWSSSLSASNYMYLNSTGAAGTDTNAYKTISSTTNQIGTDVTVNTSGGSYISYCYHSVAGYSKMGTYTGTGSTQNIETGFEVEFLLIKGSSFTTDWMIYDKKRSGKNYLIASSSSAEGAAANPLVSFLSNGFQVHTSNSENKSGETFIYMAFAADPDTEAPTLASSFNAELYTGNGGTQSITGLGFSPNLTWIKDRSATFGHRLIDSVSGPNNYVESSSSSSQQGAGGNGLSTFDADGFTLGSGNAHNKSGDDFISWNWKADDNEPTIFSPSQTVADIKSTNLTLDLNLANGSYSGYGNDLTDLSSAGETFSRSSAGNIKEGFGGYYIDLEGNDQYWTSDTSVATTTGNDITIEFWIRSESPSQNSYANIIDANHGTAVSGSSGQGWVIQMRASNYNSYYFAYYDGSTYQSNSDSELFTLTNNEWTHIAIVKSGTSVQAYKNGSAGSSWTAGNANLAYPNQKIRLGQWISAASRGFNGSLAQVRFYSDALSSSEVTANYNATKGLFTTIESTVSANAAAGFSIVKYEGNGTSSARVSHGLSSTPEMIIVKELDGSSSWQVHHTGLSANNVLLLNSTSAEANPSTDFNNGGLGTVNATTFGFVSGVTDTNNVNQSGLGYIAYCFHSVSGYSKIGSYSGTGSEQLINTGFAVDFVLIKSSTTTQNWMLYDNVRGDSKYLIADSNGAEGSPASNLCTFESNGFKVYSSNSENQNGQTYIYMAFKIN